MVSLINKFASILVSPTIKLYSILVSTKNQCSVLNRQLSGTLKCSCQRSYLKSEIVANQRVLFHSVTIVLLYSWLDSCTLVIYNFFILILLSFCTCVLLYSCTHLDTHGCIWLYWGLLGCTWLHLNELCRVCLHSVALG